MVLIVGMLLLVMGFYMMGDTTVNYRFGYKLDDVMRQYRDFGGLINPEESFAIPGLARTNVTPEAAVDIDGRTMKYEAGWGMNSRHMVPQGICFAGEYICISAYDSKGANPSVLYLLDKATRQYLTTLLLEDKNHVGGIAFDGERLWIAKSGDNALSAISYERLEKAAALEADCVSVAYDDTYAISCRASFVTYYDGLLWVGVFEMGSDSVSVLRGFSFEESQEVMGLFMQDELFLPELANGAAIEEIDGHVCLIVDSSYGRNTASRIHTYELSMDEDSFEDAVCVLKDEYTFPPMAEEVEIHDGWVYFMFESAATKYSLNGGFRCRYPVDRVCAVEIKDLFGWATDGYVQQTVILEPDEPTTLSGLLYHVSTGREAKTVPAYVRTGETRKVQMLYNPYTAKMLFNIVQDMGRISEGNRVGTASWNDTLSKSGYGNLQTFRHDELSIDEGHTAPVEIVTGIARKSSYNRQEKFNIVIGIETENIWKRERDLEEAAYIFDDGIMRAFLANAETLYARLGQISYDVPEIIEADGRQMIQYMGMKFSDILEEMKTPDSRFTVTVTGFGAGGGIADLLTGLVFARNGIYEGNANCYTFGAFAVTKADRYEGSNIFNIVNADDCMTRLRGWEPWGGVLCYRATEEFERRFYGVGSERDLGMLAHSMALYEGILEEVENDLPVYAGYNTQRPDVFRQTVTIDRNCFAGFQDLEVEGTLEVPQEICLFVSRNLRAERMNIQGEVRVHGSLHADVVYISNGLLGVDGHCMIAHEKSGGEGYLEITGAQGTLEISGDMDIPYFNYTAETGKHIRLYGP